MAEKAESDDETRELRATVSETVTSALRIRQTAQQEIRRSNEVLELRTRELTQALATLRATLESLRRLGGKPGSNRRSEIQIRYWRRDPMPWLPASVKR